MNTKRLHYFMQVARSGSVMRASEKLHLTPQTTGRQIQLLEEALGATPLAKIRHGLVLTEASRLALGDAKEIFSPGAELEEAVREHPKHGRVLEFRVGDTGAHKPCRSHDCGVASPRWLMCASTITRRSDLGRAAGVTRRTQCVVPAHCGHTKPCGQRAAMSAASHCGSVPY